MPKPPVGLIKRTFAAYALSILCFIKRFPPTTFKLALLPLFTGFAANVTFALAKPA